MSARSKANHGKPSTEPMIITRRTKAGRTLEYKLTVIQEPERARACGSGAKSSADRRPVDPPPVVELTVCAIEDDGRKNDITFAYEADFFLFATLESVRDIAPVRGVHPTIPQVPVLTGMPVSGMAYLDRPKEAGYFIFPDLSVRHEGRYQLSLNLYEQTKKLDLDGDAEGLPGMKGHPKSLAGALPGMGDASFDFRMEIKSSPFTVYSAKKFPGLSESTPLSRTVAEQGCRVRIRRDVRMRRREKTTADFDEKPPEQDAYGRQGRYINQGQEPCSRERSRSVGADGGSPRTPYGGQQYVAHYSLHNTPSPQPHPVVMPAGGNLNFGGPPHQVSGAHHQFALPQAPQAPPPPPSQHFPNPPPYPPPFHIQSLVDDDYSQRPKLSHHSPPSSQAPRLPPMSQDRYPGNQWPQSRPASIVSHPPPPPRYDDHIEADGNHPSISSSEHENNKDRPTDVAL
ncbi:velvet factor-domain-containing protein [Amylocarpus encephaloides]|uniref:Velvet factor-domain-containing protein n=1 Tax=Amylocarpus encephaloides TaxID=45428 RepID=A0A9P7Y887_9HELO|nr:velvet factor-domain-containing protein [Amylocarpus encephaloides]